MEKMFITYKALNFDQQADIPSNASSTTSDPASYAATGNHHLFLLAVNSVIADAIKNRYLFLVELRRYDVPGAFLQCKLTPQNFSRPLYGCLPCDLPAPYNNKYVKFLRGIYGAKPSNRIFDLDNSATLVAIGYSTYLADPRKFLWRCKDDPRLVVILNTHVDNGAAVLTCHSFWVETIFKLN